MDTDQARTRLEEERQRLQAAIAEEEEAAANEDPQNAVEELATVDQHPADQGTETFEQEKALSILEQHQADLVDVELALRRVEDGTYGKCDACGKDIPGERLEARPAARYCLEDQKLAEQGLHPQSDPTH